MVEYELTGHDDASEETGVNSLAPSASMEEKAAVTGETGDELGQAFFERGIRYSTGRDVIPDLIAAHKWFNLAAQRGHVVAREYRNDLAREMTAKEIAQAQREAREWIKCEQEAKCEGTKRGSPPAARRREAYTEHASMGDPAPVRL